MPGLNRGTSHREKDGEKERRDEREGKKRRQTICSQLTVITASAATALMSPFPHFSPHLMPPKRLYSEYPHEEGKNTVGRERKMRQRGGEKKAYIDPGHPSDRRQDIFLSPFISTLHQSVSFVPGNTMLSFCCSNTGKLYLSRIASLASVSCNCPPASHSSAASPSHDQNLPVCVCSECDEGVLGPDSRLPATGHADSRASVVSSLVPFLGQHCR